jgi:hypothetical protein
MSHVLSLRAHVRELPSFRLFLMLWGGLLLLDVVRSTGPGR